MRRNFLHIIFLVCIQYNSILFAQDIIIKTQTDSTTYLIGDYIRFDMQIQSPATNQFTWPAMDSIAPGLEFISISGIDTTPQANEFLLHQQIVLSGYDSGNYIIKSIPLMYKKQGDTALYFVASDSIRLRINTIPVDTTRAFKPIKDNITVSVTDYTWLYILLGIIALSVIGFLIWRIYQKRKNKPSAPEKPTPVTLYAYTIAKLKSLEEKKLWQQDAFKQYHSELTDILREYLEHRYGMQAPELTSDEIIEQAVNAGIPSDLITALNYMFRIADLAKFAKSKPLPNENTQCMQNAYHFIEQTKVMEEMKKEIAQ